MLTSKMALGSPHIWHHEPGREDVRVCTMCCDRPAALYMYAAHHTMSVHHVTQPEGALSHTGMTGWPASPSERLPSAHRQARLESQPCVHRVHRGINHLVVD